MEIDIIIEQSSMKVSIHTEKLEGEIPIFDTVLARHNESGGKIGKIVFNFDEVQYINSLGIAEFISIIRYFSGLNEKTKFKFINLDKKIAKVFKMVEMHNLADIDTK
ncbi:MAG: hypothetical protein ABUK01_03790 [Leptospirales bacterium]